MNNSEGGRRRRRRREREFGICNLRKIYGYIKDMPQRIMNSKNADNADCRDVISDKHKHDYATLFISLYL